MLIESFETFTGVYEKKEGTSIGDAILIGLDHIAIFLHKNDDVRHQIINATEEVGDDLVNSFVWGLSSGKYGTDYDAP